VAQRPAVDKVVEYILEELMGDVVNGNVYLFSIRKRKKPIYLTRNEVIRNIMLTHRMGNHKRHAFVDMK